MDNYKSLFDKKQYDLVEKLTRTSSNVEDLYYCLSALVAQNKLNEALHFIEEKRNILEVRLPTLMSTHVELLCLTGQFQKAKEIAKYYENMPYHSQQAEETLQKLPLIIERYEKKEGSHYIDEEENQKLLLSKDPNQVLQGLDALREKDLRPYYLYINKILTSFPKQSIRSFCLLLLVQKEVDKEFNFLHVDKMITVNPKKLKPPFEGTEFMELKSRMQEDFKDSSLSENALQILSSYLIYIYPAEVDYSDPNLLEALKKVSSSYMRLDLEIKENEEVEEISKKIFAALEDF